MVLPRLIALAAERLRTPRQGLVAWPGGDCAPRRAARRVECGVGRVRALPQRRRRNPDGGRQVASEQERQALGIDTVVLEAGGRDGFRLLGIRRASDDGRAVRAARPSPAAAALITTGDERPREVRSGGGRLLG